MTFSTFPDDATGENLVIMRNKVRLGTICLETNTVTDYRGRTYQASSFSDAFNYFKSRRWDISRTNLVDPETRVHRTNLVRRYRRWADND